MIGLAWAALGCVGSNLGFTPEPDCAEAEARLGFRACVAAVPDEPTFASITVAAVTVDQLRTGKYLVPAAAEATVPPVFLDVNAFPLHYDFLTQAFPDRFPGLTTGEYESLILHPGTRQYYAGTVSLYLDGDGIFYGFTVWDDPADATSTVTVDQVTAAWDQLRRRFSVGTLEWVPNSSAQVAASRSWTNTPFPRREPAELDFEAYTPGEGVGYLRLYSIDAFNEASEAASYGYQDLVVVEEAPEDIYRVVSGIVTGSRQGTLSHLNVRSAARGTPNCYVREPLTALAPYRDQLVRFACRDEGYSVTPATPADAEAWWGALRPDPVSICEANLPDLSMPGLRELDTATAEARQRNLCTYGAKGANLAALYQRIPEAYQLDGFVIPFGYYDSFIHAAGWRVDLGDGAGVAYHSFADTLDAWHRDPAFTSDATVRVSRLTALREAFMAAPVPEAILSAIGERIRAEFGSDAIAVRMRSSSNAEDGVGFSGAGLYESRTACLADDLDGDSAGPSRCDADKADERTLADALRWVWASTWKLSAWDERDWYGIDQGRVAMGLLCDTRSKGELANAVAFSGNPMSAGDGRYLVNAQIGELEVVIPEPGIYPEKVLLTVTDGAVSAVERVSPSSEADLVLTDAELFELGGLLSDIVDDYPQDDPVPEGHDLLWDTEWKVLADGRLIIKQIRPWLR